MLIIILPSILFQCLIVYLFYERHWSNVVTHTSQLISNNISAIITTINAGNSDLADKLAKQLNIDLKQTSQDYRNINNNVNKREFNILYQTLLVKFNNVKIIEYENELEIFIPHLGHVLQFNISSKPLVNPTAYVFVLWLLFLNLFVILISIIFTKNQIRSILDLAKAADQFGKGIKSKHNFKPSGAQEIRLAGLAFIKMRERIENQINKHTKMLAMISHDLKTPLTRLKLQLEFLSTSENDAIKDDINSMQQMIDSYLSFARGELTEETIEVNLSEFIKEYCGYNQYPNLKILLGLMDVNLSADINTKNFNRVLDNILSNSSRYATKCKISLYKNLEMINLDIEDNGPGVDDKEKEMILKPFYRSDTSRHLGKEGNVGLGLTIAKEIVREQGGFLKILNSEDMGGLMVKILIKFKSY
jgi:two-component system osmolarity sensor histidine kinase EnvZ